MPHEKPQKFVVYLPSIDRSVVFEPMASSKEALRKIHNPNNEALIELNDKINAALLQVNPNLIAPVSGKESKEQKVEHKERRFEPSLGGEVFKHARGAFGKTKEKISGVSAKSMEKQRQLEEMRKKKEEEEYQKYLAEEQRLVEEMRKKGEEQKRREMSEAERSRRFNE